MQKKPVILLIYSLLPILVLAQMKPLDPDSSVFTKWVNIQKARKESNYIGFGPWWVNGQGARPLIFESQLRQDFLLYRGRSNQVPFLRSLMLSFDMGLNFRMSQGPDNPSYPIRPMNFMPGITLYYFLNHPLFAARNIAMLDSTRISNFYSLKITLSHFSNGQSRSFYNADSTNSNRENGNFSTNFLRTELSWSRFMHSSLLSASVSFQKDFGIGDLLSFSDGLQKSYGRSRIGLSLLFHSKGFQLGQYNYKKITYLSLDPGTEHKKLLRVRTSRKYKRFFSISARYDATYISGDLSYYPTFKHVLVAKNRLNHQFIVRLHPANSRTLSIFFSIYSGRDRYNVCYLDKITNIKAGLNFDLNKYLPPNIPFMKVNK